MASSHESVTLTFSGTTEGPKSEIAEVPRVLGHVRLLDEVGRGAMGVVWRGRDEFLNRVVAVKLMQHRDAKSREQFVEGARAAAAIKHNNVVAVYHADQHADIVYIVMEFVQGPTLRDVLDGHGALPVELATLVTAKTLDALTAIHAAKVVHRDLKPSNVMFDPEGEVKVSDFGLSYLQSGDRNERTPMSGTPAYMAPEMFEGDTSYQSDIYAMGVMFFEMLSGRRPYTADTIEGLHAQHRDQGLPVRYLEEGGTSESLSGIVQRASHKRKMFRYKTATHMLHAVTDDGKLLRDAALSRRLRDLVIDDHPAKPRAATHSGPAPAPT